MTNPTASSPTASSPADQVRRTLEARALAEDGRLAEAQRLLDSVAAEQPEDVEVRTRLALERAWLLLENDDEASAKDAAIFARDAAQLSSSGLDQTPLGGLHIEALRLLARLPDQPSEQVAMLKKAVALASSSKDATAQAWRARLLIDLGRAQFNNGKPGAARLKLNEAITTAIELNDLAARDEAAELVTWLEQHAEVDG